METQESHFALVKKDRMKLTSGYKFAFIKSYQIFTKTLFLIISPFHGFHCTVSKLYTHEVPTLGS